MGLVSIYNFFERGRDVSMTVIFESISVVCSFIVTLVAANSFGPTGGEYIATALRELTGLQTLRLRCT